MRIEKRLEAMTPSCSSCRHWTEITGRKRQKDRVMGHCIAASCFTDMAIEGGLGCAECDPYSMSSPELHTSATFHCQHYEQKGTAT